MEQLNKTMAYLRVSTADQDLEKNKSAILHLANEKGLGQVQFVEERVSGKIPWRNRKIAEIIDSLGQEDNLIISELSRLGRSMLECMEILSIITKKGINIYTTRGNWSLDKSIQSKIVAMTFAIAAEIEHDLISKRTKEALRAKQAQGIPLGRPKGPGKSKVDKYKVEIEALLKNGSTKKFIARRYNTTSGNLHNWLKKNGLDKVKPNLSIAEGK